MLALVMFLFCFFFFCFIYFILNLIHTKEKTYRFAYKSQDHIFVHLLFFCKKREKKKKQILLFKFHSVVLCLDNISTN